MRVRKMPFLRHVSLSDEGNIAIDQKRLSSPNRHGFFGPNLLSREIETRDSPRSIKETDSFSVSNGRRRTAVTETAGQSQRMSSFDVSLPNRFAGLRVATPGNDILAELRIVLNFLHRGEKNSIIPGNHGALTRFGKLFSPEDILVLNDTPNRRRTITRSKIAG